MRFDTGTKRSYWVYLSPRYSDKKNDRDLIEIFRKVLFLNRNFYLFTENTEITKKN